MPRKSSVILLSLLLLASIGGVFLPSVRAQICQLQIEQVVFPPKIDLGQIVEVKSRVTAIFVTYRGNTVSARADLRDRLSSENLDTASLDLGLTSPRTLTVSHSVKAPSIAGTWQLQLVVMCFSGDPPPVFIVSYAFNIEIGKSISGEIFFEQQVLANGDFENGLRGWTTIGRPGYSSISTGITHSGSSLQLHMLTSPGNPYVTETQGVFQEVAVQNLRGLKVAAWYYMTDQANKLAARMRIRVGELSMSYYVTGFSAYIEPDTPTSRSMQVASSLGQWVLVSRDVVADFGAFGFRGTELFRKDGETRVLIAFEMLAYGSLTEHYFMYWDDAKLAAMLATTATATTTLTTISNPQGITSVRTEQLLTTKSEPSFPDFSFLVLVVVAVAMILAAILVARRKNMHLIRSTPANIRP